MFAFGFRSHFVCYVPELVTFSTVPYKAFLRVTNGMDNEGV